MAKVCDGTRAAEGGEIDGVIYKWFTPKKGDSLGSKEVYWRCEAGHAYTFILIKHVASIVPSELHIREGTAGCQAKHKDLTPI